MKELSPNSSREEIIATINYLVAICNALSKTIGNISNNNRSNYILEQLANLEKKIIVQGDLIVNYLGKKID